VTGPDENKIYWWRLKSALEVTIFKSIEGILLITTWSTNFIVSKGLRLLLFKCSLYLLSSEQEGTGTIDYERTCIQLLEQMLVFLPNTPHATSTTQSQGPLPLNTPDSNHTMPENKRAASLPVHPRRIKKYFYSKKWIEESIKKAQPKDFPR